MRRINRFFLWYALFLAAVFIIHHPYYWDAGLQAGMGKFIFSATEVGMWQPLSPLIMAFLQGFLWWVGLPFPLAGFILSYTFSLLLPYLVYKVGYRALGQKEAFWAAVITGFHPLLVYFAPAMLTTIPALCFVLIAYWALYEGRSGFAGFLIGLSVLTHFPMALFVIPAATTILLRQNRKKKYMQMGRFLGFFALTVSFQLVINGFLFDRPLEPFFQAQSVVQQQFNTFWYTYLPWVVGEILIASFGMFLLRKKWRQVLPLALSIILPLAYFTMIANKEPRYIVILIPFFALWGSVNVVRFKKVGAIATVLFLLLLWTVEMPRLQALHPTETALIDYAPINGLSTNMILSSPAHHFFVNVPTHMYHQQSYAVTKEMIVNKQAGLIYNPCNIVCPEDHPDCDRSKRNTLKQAERHLDLVNKIGDGPCPTYVYIP